METVLVEKKNINEVVELLKQDEVVAFPTETVFGLGVKFGNLSALEKIYEIKHRSHSKAVSLMIYDSQDIEKYAYVNTNAQKLIDEFMPGMITLVLKKKSILSDDFTAGLETIGIRIPDDPFVLEYLSGLMQTKEVYFDAAIDEMIKLAGSIPNYLEKYLDVTLEKKEKIKQIFLSK